MKCWLLLDYKYDICVVVDMSSTSPFSFKSTNFVVSKLWVHFHKLSHNPLYGLSTMLLHLNTMYYSFFFPLQVSFFVNALKNIKSREMSKRGLVSIDLNTVYWNAKYQVLTNFLIDTFCLCLWLLEFHMHMVVWWMNGQDVWWTSLVHHQIN